MEVIAGVGLLFVALITGKTQVTMSCTVLCWQGLAGTCAGRDLEQGHGLALKVGEQHVEEDILKALADFGGTDGRFFINHKDIPCNTTFASDPTRNKSIFSYFRSRRMEFTYKAAEVLLAIVSEVLKHCFRVA